ncbi:MAG: radical SAM-associated putative lipoprotein [Bacteroides sp.]|nr:radical SAM-associated putative lipoprotein [Bacteroides sp.]
MILTLLGFTSCESEQPTEYGVPHARYEVKGTVLDAEGSVVSGLGVVVADDYPVSASAFEARGEEIVYTDVNGEFIVIRESSFNRFRMYLLPKKEISSTYEPIDSVDIDFRGISPEGGKGWYKGSASQHIQIQLKGN